MLKKQNDATDQKSLPVRRAELARVAGLVRVVGLGVVWEAGLVGLV